METPMPTTDGGDSTKNIIIILLIVILIFALLGINVFVLIGNGMQWFINIFSPVFKSTLSDLGYSSGTLLESSSDLLADTSKTAIDVINGSIKTAGDLLVRASKPELDTALQYGPYETKLPSPDMSSGNIQGGQKTNWCLVGEYQNKRGCIELGQNEQCLSGQVFPTRQTCLNPAIIPPIMQK